MTLSKPLNLIFQHPCLHSHPRHSRDVISRRAVMRIQWDIYVGTHFVSSEVLSKCTGEPAVLPVATMRKPGQERGPQGTQDCHLLSCTATSSQSASLYIPQICQTGTSSQLSIANSLSSHLFFLLIGTLFVVRGAHFIVSPCLSTFISRVSSPASWQKMTGLDLLIC